MLDIEVPGSSAGAVIDAMKQWIARIKSGTGRTPIIYMNYNTWSSYLGGTSDFANYPLWVANYGVSCPTMPGAWQNWAMWQYTDSGNVGGLSPVDTNYFQGTLQDLENLANGKVHAPYDAEVTSSTAPEGGVHVAPGQTVSVTLVVKNTGSIGWDENTRLGTTGPRDCDSALGTSDWFMPDRPVKVGGPIAPGESYTFTFSLKAPTQPGTYTETFSLVQEMVVWFADQGGFPDDGVTLKIIVDDPNHPGGGIDGPASEGHTGVGCSMAHGAAPQLPFLVLLLAFPLLARRRRARPNA